MARDDRRRGGGGRQIVSAALLLTAFVYLNTDYTAIMYVYENV